MKFERWRNYVRSRTASGSYKSTKVLGEQWALMTEEEKDTYLAKQRSYSSESTAPCRIPRSETPYGLGCADWPMAEEEIEGLPDEVEPASMQWDEWMGTLVSPDRSTPLLCPEREHPTCCLHYGVGYCRASLTAPEMSRHEKVRDVIHRLVFFQQEPADGMEDLPLFLLSYHDDGGEATATKLLFLVAKLKNPVIPIFMGCECDPEPVQEGSIVTPMSVLEPLNLIWELCEHNDGNITVDNVLYTWIPDGMMKVNSFEDIMPTLKTIWKRKTKPKEKDIFMDILFAKEKSKKKAPTRKTKSKVSGSSKGKRTKAVPEEPEDDAEGKAMHDGDNEGDEDDMEDDSDIESAEDDGEDGEYEEGPGEAAPAEAVPAEAAPAEAAPAEAAPAAAAIYEEILDEPSEADRLVWEDALAATGLPHYDTATFQVTDREDRTWILGTIKPMHSGTKAEALTCYCRLHQCKPPCRRPGRAKGIEHYREWFKRGQMLPPGKCSKIDHMRIWDEMGM
jgi:hypothetical protein